MLWQLLSKPLPLEKNDLAIWRVQLPLDQPIPQDQLLSEAERAEALRFHCEKARERFIAARSGLRYLLSHYLSVLPQDLVFEKKSAGKPYLSTFPFQFNLSHSQDEILYVMTWNTEVFLGVDVEAVNAHRDCLNIARRFFIPAEAAALAALSFEEQCEAFFHLWTQKEAFVKATGQGLAYGLDRCQVSVRGDAKIIAIEDPAYAQLPWVAQKIPLGKSYQACWVMSEKPYAVHHYQLKIPGYEKR